MRKRLKLINRMLEMLEEDASKEVGHRPLAALQLSESEQTIKWRVWARLRSELSSQPVRRPFWALSKKTAGWAFATISLLVVVAIFLNRDTVNQPAQPSMLSFSGQKKMFHWKAEEVDLAGKFVIVRGDDLVIEGDRFRNVRSSSSGDSILSVNEGRFVVKYNRDHVNPPIEFQFGVYRVKVIGTVFGVELTGQFFRIGVSEGKIQVRDQYQMLHEVTSGQLLTFDRNVPKLISDAKMTPAEFQRIFESQAKKHRNNHTENRIRIREIDEHEAERFERQK